MVLQGRSKYTFDFLNPIVKDSESHAEVLRKLGLKPAGGSHFYVSSQIRKLGICTEHFFGKKINPTAKRWEDILVFNRLSGRRDSSHILRRALAQSGVEEKCAECGMLDKWNGKPIRLQIDHRDGNSVNNVPTNLRFLCPNCHSQTDNFGSKNIRRLSTSTVKVTLSCARCQHRFQRTTKYNKYRMRAGIKDFYCSQRCAKRPGIWVKKTRPEKMKIRCGLCEKEFLRNRSDLRNINYCSHSCSRIASQKAEWPDDNVLRQMVWSEPVTTIAKRFGVSSSGMKKRCKSRGIQTPPQGFWMKTNQRKAEYSKLRVLPPNRIPSGDLT